MKDVIAGSRVLVVEDEAAVRRLFLRNLKANGARGIPAESGEKALEMIREAGDFDGVILDCVLPGMGGDEVLREIRKRFDRMELPVIMVTGKGGTEDVVAALDGGANDYVTKPCDFSVILARLRTQLLLKHYSDLKNEFFGIASHDLRNPLVTLSFGVESIRMMMESGDFSRLSEMLGAMDRSAKNMLDIIRDYLDLHALREGAIGLDKRPCDLDEILREVLGANAAYASQKGIALECASAEDPPALELDVAKIKQVVENLVGNAIKFSPRDTSVRVTIERDGEDAVLRVRDEGPGLTAEDLRKVFGRFVRLSNKPTGGEKSSGFGLDICKRIVELHGGSIGVDNNTGQKGACFWVRLRRPCS